MIVRWAGIKLMDLSVCIVTRNQPALLSECVASCVEEMKRAGLEGEIIVVDNASSDGYPERLVSSFPVVRVLRNEQNLSFSAANNLAIRASSGQCVLILNDDAILHEGSLRPMLECLRANPQVGAVGPQLLKPDGSVQRGFSNKRHPHLRAMVCDLLGLTPLFDKNAWTRDLFTLHRDDDSGGETDMVAGACMLCRRSDLDALGLFDEGFYYGFEDADLCHRIQKAGLKIVYLFEPQATHHGSRSMNRLAHPTRDAIYLRGMVYYFKKHTKPLRYVVVRLTLAVAVLVRVPLVAVYRITRRANEAVDEPDRSRPTLLSIVRELLLG